MVHDEAGGAATRCGEDLSAAPEFDGAAFDEAALEAARKLFAGPCEFFHAAQTLDQLPPQRGPEVAFAGRSNVGKSSLLNALTGRRALARVSSTPGRTKQLNFFDLGGRLTLVDMPGYGYAEAAKSVKEAWQGAMFDYLRGRATLRRVMLLIDARVGFKPADAEAMTLLDKAACAFQIVLTKADKLKPPALAAMAEKAGATARAHTAALPSVLATSSETGTGIAELRAEIAALCA
ncbi:ribosome biogenesis GTP-binding protein YihA/YsxC [Elioraea rosea]|uniref:ribosome biogenesis GTP-binding protein YihA/YsxC n=1 Tax=Elioraea rosea TaxID=2492390 RepID=UPI001184276D|nr:ribosome biogenesis GTP-binding protein YihA/YsxC [Elioraea rosea]